MNINLEELARFLVKAKSQSWAGDAKESSPQRPGFKELKFNEEPWGYRDSYVGYFMAPGQEVVRFQDQPVWAMSYSGGMMPEFRGNKDFAKQTFEVLKKALKLLSEEKPYRGPSDYREGEFLYEMDEKGDIKDFSGQERIFIDTGEEHKLVFRQYFIGGLILPK